jgi:hypothetical protein
LQEACEEKIDERKNRERKEKQKKKKKKKNLLQWVSNPSHTFCKVMDVP